MDLRQTAGHARRWATQRRNAAFAELHAALSGGRVETTDARTPWDTWRSVGPAGQISIGAGAWVERDALDLVDGRLEIGAGTHIGPTERLRVGPGARLTIGARCIIESGVRLEVEGTLVIEDDVYVGRDSVIVAFERVTIGQGGLLGERVSIHDENHGPAGDRQRFRTAPVSIGEQVWLAAGVVVTSGAQVGAGSTVGANAVVTGQIASGVTAVGVPARPLSPRS